MRGIASFVFIPELFHGFIEKVYNQYIYVL